MCRLNSFYSFFLKSEGLYNHLILCIKITSRFASYAKDSWDFESCSRKLLSLVRTKKTELLFIAHFLRTLKIGGRAAVVVPSGVLESDSAAHRTIRKALLESACLDAVISLPHWIFKPYASVATAILLFRKGETSKRIWFYRMSNDGFADDAAKTPIDGSDIPNIVRLFTAQSKQPEYKPDPIIHRHVDVSEIIANDYDLCPNVYLSGYKYPDKYPLHPLSEFFEISKGKVPAAMATEQGYTFATSSEELRMYSSYSYDCEAITIPMVSATGHGHASIKKIHYINGKFEASTITAILTERNPGSIYVPYVYYYLLAHKDELLVPLMRGAANVSMSTTRLERLRIPVPIKFDEQVAMVAKLVSSSSRLDAAHYELADAKHSFKVNISSFREEL